MTSRFVIKLQNYMSSDLYLIVNTQKPICLFWGNLFYQNKNIVKLNWCRQVIDSHLFEIRDRVSSS